MRETELISPLIGAIYDAALDPSLWREALIRARQFVGGSAAALFMRDAASRSMHVWHDDGCIAPYHKQLYGETYPLPDLLRHDQFFEVRFNKEWAQPEQLTDVLCAPLDQPETGATWFGIFRHEHDGPVDNETRGRMSLIVPHIRRAVLLGRALGQKSDEASLLAEALDGLSAAMFLVGATGRIVHANASGHAMLTERRVLRSLGGKLVASDGKAAKSLSGIFSLAADGGNAGTVGVAVPISAEDEELYVAHVLPLASASRRQGRSSGAAAAVFVHKAVMTPPSSPELISRLYDLTRSELRVLLAIVQAGGVSEAADMLGIGEATVKTHLHRVFGKTGVARQADLVKLVAGFSSPVLGQRRLPAPAQRPQSYNGRFLNRAASV